VAVEVHCIVYVWLVIGLNAVTDVVGKSAARIVGGNSTHARGTDGEIVGVGCPGAHQGAEGDCCAETGSSDGFLHSSGFLFVCFVCRVSGWPSVSSMPSAPEAATI
jgi:hypothetical protein